MEQKVGLFIRTSWFSKWINPIVFLVFLLVFLGCKEVTTILPSPSVAINSITQTSFASFEVEIMIQPGEGQVLNSIDLELQDLTILNSEVITEKISLNESMLQSPITYKCNTERINHDFQIKAILNTNKYSYESEPVIYRSTKNRFFFSIPEDETFGYLEPELARLVNSGSQFVLIANYLSQVDEKVKVFLNGTIECENDINLKLGDFADDGIVTSGVVKLPEDILSGDYTVNIYLQDYEFTLSKKIRVLEGKWSVFNNNYKGKRMGEYAWFKIDDQLYVVGGRYNSSSVINSPVWSLNLANGTWNQKKDFKWPPEFAPYRKKIYANELSYNNEGYIVLQTDDRKVEIWHYNATADTWNKVTDYPGAGADNLLCFISGNELFTGGGVKLELNNDHNVTDFWSYNLENKNWIQLNDMPVKPAELWWENIACAANGKGYVFQFPDKLWEYNPQSDSWTEKTKFPGPKRVTTRLVPVGNKIYLTGGYYSYLWNTSYKDTWEYSMTENSWKFKAFMPQFTNYGIATSYNNDVIVGLGYALYGYSYSDEPIIYKFSP